eukprot:GGOE01061085.1.p1 GENE.GGOE01061085.1~~GGOE01061085.1.p1  ORF type:complete len:1085 (-),score=361.65 GGOE01061085.1:88-3342(-)
MAHTFVGFSLLEGRVYSGLKFVATHDEHRLWLEEHVLGTLMPCLQELIREVLAKEEEARDPSAFPTPPLNPIDWLASLLMRHNPRHNAAAAQHPYYRLLQEHVCKARLNAPKAMPASALATGPPFPEEGRAIADPPEAPQRPTEEAPPISEEDMPLPTEGTINPTFEPTSETEAEGKVEAEAEANLYAEAENGDAADVVDPHEVAKVEEQREEEKAEEEEEAGAEGAANEDEVAEEANGQETQASPATEAEPEPTWDDYHEARQAMQQEEMLSVLDQLQEQVEAAATQDDLSTLFCWVPDRIAEVMDGAACYIARCDAEAETLTYLHASHTCSAALASGTVVLRRSEHPDAPSFQAMIGACCVYIAGVRDSPEVVMLGDLPEPGDGDLFTGCILGLAGTPVALLSVDTLAAADSMVARRPTGPRPICDAEQQFLQRVMEQLGAAHSNVTAASIAEDVKAFGEASAHLGAQPLCDHAIQQLASALSRTCNVYISAVEEPRAATLRVVAQLASAVDRGHSALLGCSLSSDRDPAGLAFSLLSSPEALYYVPNTTQEPAVAAYAADGQSPPAVGEGCLCVAAIRDADGRVVAVLGVEDGVDGLYDAHLAVITAVAQLVADGLTSVALHRRRAEVAQQAIEWVAGQTGLSNLYISIGDANKGLNYIATSPSQAFLLGQVLGPTQGLSCSLVQSEGSFRGAAADEPKLHFWNETQRGQPGDVLLLPLAAPGHPAVGVFGCDTLGTDRTISPLEEACIAEVARYLAVILGEGQPGPPLGDTLDEVSLSIEGTVGPERVRFLKRMWVEVLREIASLPKSDLQELAGYSAPPAMVHTVVSGCLVLLGSKPSAVARWAACRPKVKPPLLGRITKLDPTQPGRKAKFIRVRKMLRGLTVNLVHDKGSRPTSLLYRWCSLAVQLRYTADALRKQQPGQRGAALLLPGPEPDVEEESAEEEADGPEEQEEVEVQEEAEQPSDAERLVAENEAEELAVENEGEEAEELVTENEGEELAAENEAEAENEAKEGAAENEGKELVAENEGEELVAKNEAEELVAEGEAEEVPAENEAEELVAENEAEENEVEEGEEPEAR